MALMMRVSGRTGSVFRAGVVNGGSSPGRGEGGGVLSSPTVAVPQRGMANLKLIRNRMRSVGSISKITKAMKMVAAAKLRGVQNKQEQARPFSDSMEEFFKVIGGESGDGKGGEKTTLLIPLSSDRGLCGGVNSSVVKEVKSILAAHKEGEMKILLLGDKGRDALSRVAGKDIIISFKDVFKALPTFPQVCLIAEEILSRNFDVMSVVFNKFKSVISQEVTRKNIYGLEFLQANASLFDDYEFDTDLEGGQAFRDLFEFQLATQLYSSMLENSTSEQAARMAAMDNATNNAADMLSALTLKYNRQRQAIITSELIEIISGAEALKG